MQRGMLIWISIIAVALSCSNCIGASDKTNGLSILASYPFDGDHSAVTVSLCNHGGVPITIVTNDISPTVVSNAGGRLVCVFFEPHDNWGPFRNYAPVTLHSNQCTEIFYRFTADLSAAQFQSNFPGISSASNATICLVQYRISKDFAEQYGVWSGEIQTGLKTLQPSPSR